MSVMPEDELPACADCLKHDGGWSAWCDECHVLAREELAKTRARLAEVEAELDQALNDCHHVPALAEAEARLAEVEAERDGWKLAADHRTELHGELVERLAAVEAALESNENCDGYPEECSEADGCYVKAVIDKVRTAARGEGDRG